MTPPDGLSPDVLQVYETKGLSANGKKPIAYFKLVSVQKQANLFEIKAFEHFYHFTTGMWLILARIKMFV
ncbi:MAG: hypothetical protein CR984_06070 [Proteobacteria bacterium]|nr:MAG: hypothetical protein CR984_06070 [Pseudomonadota bacterium]